MRWVEELYDVRYARDTADINGDDADEGGNDTERISSVFPVFVVEFFSKRCVTSLTLGADSFPHRRLFPALTACGMCACWWCRYGLRSLVEQMCWDLLYNVHTLRKDNLEVEIFARFLEVRHGWWCTRTHTHTLTLFDVAWCLLLRPAGALRCR